MKKTFGRVTLLEKAIFWKKQRICWNAGVRMRSVTATAQSLMKESGIWMQRYIPRIS